jgi:glutaconate CoA-transferase subunit A
VRRSCGEAATSPAFVSDDSAHTHPLVGECGERFWRLRGAGAIIRRMNKVIPLAQLSTFVRPGDSVGLGGAWLSNHPMAAVRQLLRSRIGELHVIGSLNSIDLELLVGAGLVSEVTFSMVSLEAYGLSASFRRAVQEGQIVIHEVSGVAMTVALEAGARRLPCLPMRGIGESQLIDRAPEMYSVMTCPFTGERLLAIRAHNPDVAIIHARRADAAGNAQVDGPLGNDPELARAAERVVITCERLVDSEEVARNPASTHIPGFLVDAVIEAPFGAHPTTHVPDYGLDVWAINDYAEAAHVNRDAEQRQLLAAETEEEYRARVLDNERRTVLRTVAQTARTIGAPR